MERLDDRVDLDQLSFGEQAAGDLGYTKRSTFLWLFHFILPVPLHLQLSALSIRPAVQINHQKSTSKLLFKMRPTNLLTALLSLNLTTTMARHTAAGNGKRSRVDLSGLADGADLENRHLERRDDCPSQQTCVGHRCVMLECEEIGDELGTTTCITFKYGDC